MASSSSHFDLIYGESLLPVLQNLSKTAASKTVATSAAQAATQNKIRDKPIRRPDNH